MLEDKARVLAPSRRRPLYGLRVGGDNRSAIGFCVFLADSFSLDCWPKAGIENAIRNNSIAIGVLNLLPAEFSER
ncbi:MAG TPA: hypothetical protein VFK65_11700, partial [Candidatus Binatia bacterium]|nr:hypothetical protein [Candidatus Binatia bacterium]